MENEVDADQECKHLMLVGTCTLCSGKDSIMPAKPEAVLWDYYPKRRGHRDPDAELAAGVADGRICGQCLTAHAPMGCECSRKELHYRAELEVQAWLKGDGLESNLFSSTELAGLAFSTQRRTGLRAGLTPEDHEADRMDIIREFEVKPRWKQYRRNEATHLPV